MKSTRSTKRTKKARKAEKAERPRGSGARPAGPRADSGITLADVARDRRFMAVVGLTFLVGAVMQQGSSTLAVDMGADGFSARQYGLVIAINGLVIVLLQIPLTHLVRHRGSGSLLAAGSLLMAWGFGLTAFAGSVAVYSVTVVVWTLGEIVHAPASMSVVADLAPVTARGRYQGMYSLAWSGAAFAGPLAGGLTLDHLGRAAVWWGCAIVGTAAGAGYYALLRVRPQAPALLDTSAAGSMGTVPAALDTAPLDTEPVRTAALDTAPDTDLGAPDPCGDGTVTPLP